MIGKVDTSQGSAGIEVTNGVIQEYYTTGEEIEPNTFVTIVGGQIEIATSTIDGVTITSANQNKQGKIYVLGGGS